MENLVKCGKVERFIYDKKNVQYVKGLFDEKNLNEEQKNWLEEQLKNFK